MDLESLKRAFLVVLVLPFMFLCGGCNLEMRKPGKIQPVFKNGEVAFEIDYGSSNGLLGLKITDVSTRRKVWDIRLSYYSGARLKYGEVPQDFKTFNGATNSAKQKTPETGVPSKLVEGKIYRMYSDWQYDRLGAATAEDQTQFFEIRDKKIVFVKNPNPKPPPKKPSER